MLADYETNTWVTYTGDQTHHRGKAAIQRDTEVLAEIETPLNLPHNYVLWVEFDGSDAWVGTSKGLGHAIGEGYYPGLRPNSRPAAGTKNATRR